MWKGGEECAACRDHPDFIAVPDRCDGADDLRTIFVVFREEGNERTDAVIEAFQDKEACEEYSNEDKPDNLKIHRQFPLFERIWCLRM